MDYTELVKRLREQVECDKKLYLQGMPFETLLLDLAADAIKELQQIADHYEECAKDYFKDVCYYKERVPKWIPVEERLPVGGDASGEICENVNLLLNDGLVTCGWMNGITGKAYYLNVRDDFVQKTPISRVTHWMPLPEPPKEEQDGT